MPAAAFGLSVSNSRPHAPGLLTGPRHQGRQAANAVWSARLAADARSSPAAVNVKLAPLESYGRAGQQRAWLVWLCTAGWGRKSL